MKYPTAPWLRSWLHFAKAFHPRRARFRPAILAASIAAWLSAPSAPAASQIWTGGSGANGNWSTGLNWAGGSAPGSTSATSLDIATFNAAIANTWGDAVGNPIFIDAGRNLGGISFTGAAGNYFIGSTGGNTLKLSSGGTIQILNMLTATNAIETINVPLEIQGANGTYTLANNSASGTGTGAGTLIIAGAITGGTAGATVLTLDGSNTNANTISGIIDNGAATSLAVTKTGAGNWTLTGANTYTGATTINAGTLSVATIGNGGVSGHLGAASSAAANLVFDGGTLRYTGATASTDRSFTINAGQIATFDIASAATNLTLSGVGTGAGALTKIGAGTLTLSGANTFTGGSAWTTVKAGTLEVASGGVINHGSTNAFVGFGSGDNGSLQITGGSVTDYVGILGYEPASNGTATISSGTWSNNHSLFVGISGTGTVNLTGTGVVAVAGGAGPLTLALYEGSAGTLNLGTGGLAGTLNAGSVDGGAGTATVNLNHTGSYTPAPQFIGSLRLNKLGAGTTTLTGTNTYTGPTTISAGTLSVATIGNGGVSGHLGAASSAAANLVFDGGTLRYTGTTASTDRSFTINASQTATFDIASAATNLTLSGVGTGAGALTKTGAGTLTLSGANTFTSASSWTTVKAGTLEVASGGAINHGGAYVLVGFVSGDNGSLQITGGSVTDYAGILGFQPASNGTATISSGTWSNNFDLGVGRSGTGTLNLTGTGVVAVAGGAGPLTLAQLAGSAGTLNLGTGGLAGTLNAGSVNGGAGTATVNLNHTGSYTLAPQLTGSLRLNKLGAGTTTLTGTNTYTGPTTISAGTLSVGTIGDGGVSGNLGAASSAAANLVFDGGTLRYTGTTASTDRSFTINGSQIATFDIASAATNLTLSGAAAGTNGALTKTGAGTLTLSGVNTFTSASGWTTVKAGTLEVASGGAINHGGTYVSVGSDSGDNGSLQITGGSVTDYEGYLGFQPASNGTATISSGTWSNNHSLFVGVYGTGTVNLTGTGVVAVTGGAGPLILALVPDSAGTLNLGTGGAAGTLNAGSVDGGAGTATVNLNHTGGYTLGPQLTGTLQLNKLGAGTTTLTGTNTYTGPTTISAGTLSVATIGNGGVSGNLGAASSAAANLVFDGGTLRYTGTTASTDRSFTIIAGQTATFDITTAATNLTLSGVGTGAGALTKIGAGTLTLTGANAYTGATTISAGTLEITSGGTISAASAIAVNNGGNLKLSRNDTWGIHTTATSSAITVDAGGTLASNNTYTTLINLTLNGGTVLANGGGNTGFQSFALKGTVTVGGTQASQINAGTGNGLNSINIGDTAAPGTTTFAVADATGNANADLIINVPLKNSINAAALASSLTKTGAGTLVLSGANTYTGATTISAGTLSVATIGNGGVSGNLGAASGAAANLVFDGGALQYTGATASTNRSFTINAGKIATFDIATAATNLTLSGGAAATNGALTKIGAGKLILTGANLHTGTTTVSNGTLEAAAAGALGATGNVTVNTGGTLLLSNAGTTDRIHNGAIVTLAGGTVAFSGNVTEGSSPGTGPLTLSANSIIDFNLLGNEIINFGASNLASWNPGGPFPILCIWNWDGSLTGGGNDQLKFGINSTALTSGQLSQISFYSDNGTMAGFLGTGTFVGSLGEVVPVPEPSSVLVGLTMFGLAGWRERRNASRVRQAERQRNCQS